MNEQVENPIAEDEKTDRVLTDQDKRNFCALMLKKYGLSLSIKNEMLPMFYVAYMSAVISETTSKQSRDSIIKIVSEFEKAAGKKLSKMSVEQYQFQSAKDAFWFGFGRYGIVGLALAILTFFGWFFYRASEVEKTKNEQISNFIKNAKVEQRAINNGVNLNVVRLYETKDLNNLIEGTHYVYNKECNCIEVPISYMLK